jgi:DNA modification methylase
MRSGIIHCKAEEFPDRIKHLGPIDLLLTDPPYNGIVGEKWDKKKEPNDFADEISKAIVGFKLLMSPKGSLIYFGGTGTHKNHPLFRMVSNLEQHFWYRNWLTWRKRRGYGKEFDYLFIREEAIWMSMSEDRVNVTFNIPLTSEIRGYKGFNKKYPAKSEYKRVGNVFDDFENPGDVIHYIPELMRPKRTAQKAPELMKQLIETHTNPGDLIVDPYAGYGTTGIVAVAMGRRFAGCEAIKEDAKDADNRMRVVIMDMEHGPQGWPLAKALENKY